MKNRKSDPDSEDAGPAQRSMILWLLAVSIVLFILHPRDLSTTQQIVLLVVVIALNIWSMVEGGWWSR